MAAATLCVKKCYWIRLHDTGFREAARQLMCSLEHNNNTDLVVMTENWGAPIGSRLTWPNPKGLHPEDENYDRKLLAYIMVCQGRYAPQGIFKLQFELPLAAAVPK